MDEGYRNLGGPLPVRSAPCLQPPARRSYPRRVLPVALSLSTGEVILIVVLVAIPIALATFVLGAGNALQPDRQGPVRGRVRQRPAAAGHRQLRCRARGEAREAEIRQMLEAKAYRQRARGERAARRRSRARQAARRAARQAASGADPGLAEEVRQLVVARNERRVRQGKEPLDVDQEVERQLRELENLGQ